jgi:hypothetical protein
MSSELKVLSENNNDTVIITFGGAQKKFGGIQPFEFLNFLTNNFKDCDKYFYIDKKTNRYHLGIEGISNNIEETVEYIKNILISYKNVYFMGVSAGGYAAILFGSLLNVSHIIAFIPPTQCNQINDKRKFDNKYSDLLYLINNKTQYHLFGDLSINNINNSHHISHCDRLKIYPNVTINQYSKIDLIQLRNNGELLKILTSIIKF